MSNFYVDSKGQKITDEVVQHVLKQCSIAAVQAANALLLHGSAQGYSTMVTDDGQMVGAVVVSLDPKSAQELVDWVDKKPRAFKVPQS